MFIVMDAHTASTAETLPTGSRWKGLAPASEGHGSLPPPPPDLLHHLKLHLLETCYPLRPEPHGVGETGKVSLKGSPHLRAPPVGADVVPGREDAAGRGERMRPMPLRGLVYAPPF